MIQHFLSISPYKDQNVTRIYTYSLPVLDFLPSMRDFVDIMSSATSNNFEESPSIILTTSCGVVNIDFVGSGCNKLHQNISSFRLCRMRNLVILSMLDFYALLLISFALSSKYND